MIRNSLSYAARAVVALVLALALMPIMDSASAGPVELALAAAPLAVAPAVLQGMKRHLALGTAYLQDALTAAGSFAQSIDVFESIAGLSPADFEAYIQNTNPFEVEDALLGDVLFPRDDTDSLDFKYVIGGSRAAVMADVTSHLGEAPIVGRRVPGTRSGSIPAIKQKRFLDAETLIRLQGGQGDAAISRAVQEVFDDTTAVRRAVRSTIELLRMQALAYGIVTLDWVGVQGAFDYGVPAGHKAVLSGTALWTDAASDPLANLEAWQNTLVADTGNRATLAVTSTAVIQAVLKHEKVRRAIGGVNYDRRITLGDLNAMLDASGLPLLVAYDQQAKRLNAAGAEVNTRYFPSNRITLLPTGGAAPAPMGRTLTAPTAEEAVRDIAEGRIAIDGDRIAVHTYLASQDPKGLMTLGVGSMFPTFEQAENVFQAQVLA